MHVYIKEFTDIQILLKKLTIHQGACFIVYVGVYGMALYVYTIVHVLGGCTATGEVGDPFTTKSSIEK
jgi:hypothetical protein